MKEKLLIKEIQLRYIRGRCLCGSLCDVQSFILCWYGIHWKNMLPLGPAGVNITHAPITPLYLSLNTDNVEVQITIALYIFKWKVTERNWGQNILLQLYL